MAHGARPGLAVRSDFSVERQGGGRGPGRCERAAAGAATADATGVGTGASDTADRARQSTRHDRREVDRWDYRTRRVGYSSPDATSRSVDELYAI